MSDARRGHRAFIVIAICVARVIQKYSGLFDVGLIVSVRYEYRGKRERGGKCFSVLARELGAVYTLIAALYS